MFSEKHIIFLSWILNDTFYFRTHIEGFSIVHLCRNLKRADYNDKYTINNSG